ncbi:MAG TPA: YciI family protein [Nannocystaceae bacterium]|nr:YciI family protein [Nannocystaceae bacterium]
MKRTLLIASLVLFSACRPHAAASPSAPPPPSNEVRPIAETKGHDAELAKELGADKYGMRPYVMALLRAGPTPPADAEKMNELMRGHLDNIQRLADDGVLVLAGPFADDGELRGIYVFAVASVDEARELTATDPAIGSGALVMELHPWYGSAALGKVNEIHERIALEHP